MLHVLRRSIALIEPGTRGRWLLLVFLALIVSLAEAVGAGLIFVMLGLITSTEQSLAVPLIGNLDQRFPDTDRSTMVVVTAAFIAVFFVVRGGVYLVQSYLQNRIAHNAGVRLSTRLLRGYMRMPYQTHLRRNSSELIRNAHGSVTEIVIQVFVPMVGIMSEGLLVLGIFVALLVLAPTVTLLMLAFLFPLLLLLQRVVQPKMATLGSIGQERLQGGLQVLQQSLEGVRDIKILGREQFFERRFATIRSDLSRVIYMRSVLLDVPRVAVETFLILGILATLAITVVGAGSPETVLSTLGLFAYAVMRVLPSLNRILANLNSIRFGGSATIHVFDDLTALDTEPDRREDSEPLPFRERILLEGVAFRFDPSGPDVLSEIDLEIRRGETVAVVGTTGAGKSTLLDLVLGLIEPTQGSISVDGIDIRGPVRAWQQNLGVVSQSVFLFDDTLRRNIALAEEDADIDDLRVDEAVHMAQIEEFVESLQSGLETVVGERGVRLSGGQRQRIAIARALYRRPELLVLDEGTSALDTATEAAFTHALEKLRGSRTVITVAHRLSTVRHYDRIVLLEAGRITDCGTFDELFERSPSFRQLVG